MSGLRNWRGARMPLTEMMMAEQIDTQKAEGPPIARAHSNLARALLAAQSGVAMDRIEGQYRRRLDSLIAVLLERGDDWEDEWPK